MGMQSGRLASVNVGGPRETRIGDKVVRTSIWKEPVPGRVAVRGVNLAGDVSFAATDTSSDALDLARENAVGHAVADVIEFVEADLLPREVTGDTAPIDVLVANLPYVRSDAMAGLPIAASFEPRLGANPPSSPWPVECPSSWRRVRKAAKTSAPARSASANVAAPIGATMNSWKSVESWACLPPLRMLKNGTGRVRAPTPPR